MKIAADGIIKVNALRTSKTHCWLLIEMFVVKRSRSVMRVCLGCHAVHEDLQ